MLSIFYETIDYISVHLLFCKYSVDMYFIHGENMQNPRIQIKADEESSRNNSLNNKNARSVIVNFFSMQM